MSAGGTGDRLKETLILCASIRCVAAAELTDPAIKKNCVLNRQIAFSTDSESVRLQKYLTGGVTIPVSFRGLGDAFDALQKQ